MIIFRQYVLLIQYTIKQTCKILEDANVANYVYKEIIQWAINAQESKIDFRNLKKTRDGSIKEITTLLPWLKSTASFVIKTILETNSNPQPIDVTVFDFKTQLLSLLNDKTLFGNIENLDIDPQNPFGPYKAPDDILSAVNSGMRYRNAYKIMIKNQRKSFFYQLYLHVMKPKSLSLEKPLHGPYIFRQVFSIKA